MMQASIDHHDQESEVGVNLEVINDKTQCLIAARSPTRHPICDNITLLTRFSFRLILLIITITFPFSRYL